MHPHLPGDVPKHHMTVLEPDAECGIGEVFGNLALHLDDIFLRHMDLPARETRPLKFAFFSRLSY